MLVLIVDDDLGSLMGMEEAVKTMGHTVDAFSSPKKAMEKIRFSHYDAALIDFYMPEISGIQLAADIIRDNPDMKVILVSGYADRANLSLVLESIGPNVTFEHKPLDFNVLRKILSELAVS